MAKANERNQTIDGSNRSPNWINVYQENHKKKFGSSSINHRCCLDLANGFVYFFVGFITNTGQASIIYRNLSIVYAAKSEEWNEKFLSWLSLVAIPGLWLAAIENLITFEDQEKVNKHSNDWKMIWHSSLNWTDTKQFSFLFRRSFITSSGLEWNSWWKMVSGENRSVAGVIWAVDEWRQKN